MPGWDDAEATALYLLLDLKGHWLADNRSLLRADGFAPVTGRTHTLAATSLAFGAGSLANLHGPELGALVGGAFVTSAQTKIRWKRQRIMVGLSPDIDCAWPLNRVIEHREQTHWPHTALMVVAATFLAAWQFVPAWTWVAVGAVAAGWGSHLVLDALTRDGIPKGPGFKGRLHLLPRGSRLRSGGLVERVLFWVALAGFGIFMYAHFTSLPN